MARKQYTSQEKYEYHMQKAKKGAKNAKGKRLSDFKRGEHMGRAKQIAAAKRK